ncbi:hypothetical protein T02_6020 [Trichinella nativa]|uniref:Uncharacterized protein n=1 Tax=Trichinella nativa TaxID=6335 RepID=A0A0V1LRY1_9BILA|nr:hypothetical protein T02_6020 [Trichinella nativa]
MEDMSDLRLVLNCGGSMRLVFEGRAHKLKYTDCYVNEFRSHGRDQCKHHIETCQVYEHLTYKMKKAVLRKSFPAIYDKEASAREACQGKILGIMEATKVISQKDCIASCPAELSK